MIPTQTLIDKLLQIRWAILLGQDISYQPTAYGFLIIEGGGTKAQTLADFLAVCLDRATFPIIFAYDFRWQIQLLG